VLEREYPSALGTNQVVVSGRPNLYLISLKAFIEIVLRRKTQVHQQGECPVDRRLAKLLASLAECLAHLVGREIPRRLKEYPRNRFPLVREWKLPLPQLSA
jgi:hypothetical protein